MKERSDYDNRRVPQIEKGGRTVRGSSWGSDQDYARADYRNFSPPNERYVNNGFRVARSLPIAGNDLRDGTKMSTIEDHDREQNERTTVDDAGPTWQDNELVIRCAPRWAWDVIDETLALDMSSVAFDEETRQSAANALQAMIDACENDEGL